MGGSLGNSHFSQLSHGVYYGETISLYHHHSMLIYSPLVAISTHFSTIRFIKESSAHSIPGRGCHQIISKVTFFHTFFFLNLKKVISAQPHSDLASAKMLPDEICGLSLCVLYFLTEVNFEFNQSCKNKQSQKPRQVAGGASTS